MQYSSSLWRCILALVCGLLLAPLAIAEPLQFVVVGKTTDRIYFPLVGKGCAEAAAADGNSCVLLAPAGPSHFRRQDEVMSQAIDRNPDAIAVSVVHSRWLARHSLQRLGDIPLITFDSDLEPSERHLRRGYVGDDNLAFGRQLGRLAERFQAGGGRLCILSGNPLEPNLEERIRGIRQQLGGGNGELRLNGENGWHEAERCPLYSADYLSMSLTQIGTILRTDQVDVILSIGSWPVHDAHAYRRQIGPLLVEYDRKGSRPVIITSVVGKPDAAQRTLLADGLVQAYLGVDPYETGRQSYRLMKRVAQGKSIPEMTLIDSHLYLPEQFQASPRAAH